MVLRGFRRDSYIFVLFLIGNGGFYELLWIIIVVKKYV